MFLVRPNEKSIISTPPSLALTLLKPTFFDVDNDGDFDMFVGTETGKISFYENKGDKNHFSFNYESGSLNPLDTIQLNGGYSSPFFVDIDGDGDKDLFSLFVFGIYYYKNIGSNTIPYFKLQADSLNPMDSLNTYVGSNSASPYFVDIDNDNDYDLFVGNYNGTINFFKNIGTINNPIFSCQKGANNPLNGVDVSTFNSFPTFVDIDNDGDFDAFIGNYGGVIYYYKNIGTKSSPVFTLQQNYLNPFNNINNGTYSALTFIDIDNDGDPDAFAGGNDGIINYYENIGDKNSPSFFQQNNCSNPFTKDFYVSFSTFVDIDNDGDLDCFKNTAGNIRYYKNEGTPSVPNFILQSDDQNPFYQTFLTGVSNSLSFVDIDNDGDMDAFAGYYGNIKYFKNEGTLNVAKFTLQNNSSNLFNGITIGTECYLSFVDIDNDSDLDAFIGTYLNGIEFYENTGNQSTPVFVSKTGTTNPFDSITIGNSLTPSFIDIDDDGDQDAFVGESWGNVYYFENIGTSSIPSFVLHNDSINPLYGLDYGEYSFPSFTDLDNDGDWDIFIAEGNNYLNYLVNIGTNKSPSFINADNVLNPLGSNISGNNPLFADLDNDGDLDAVMSGHKANLEALNYYKNTGSKTNPIFQLQSDSLDPFKAIWFSGYGSLVDIDNDSDYDFFMCGGYGPVYYLRNEGSSQNPIFILHVDSLNPFDNVGYITEGKPTFVDIDDDGDMDAFFGNYYGLIRFFKNTGTKNAPSFIEQTSTLNLFNSISVGYESTPKFFDIDDDGDKDAFIGEYDGNINFFENTGTNTNPVFILQDDSINPLREITETEGVAEFVDIDGDGDIDIFTGKNGQLADYDIHFYRNEAIFNNISIKSTNTSLICKDMLITLSGEGAYNYSWTPEIKNDIPFTIDSTTTFQLIGESGNGCKDTSQITIKVDSLISPIVIANTSVSTVCEGAQVVLYGSGANKYCWTNNISDSIAFIPQSTAIYQVTGTDVNGCSDTNQILITVISHDTLSAYSSSSAICKGDSVLLYGTGMESYNWDNGVIDSLFFIPTTTTAYTVVGTDTKGCQDSSQITIQVNIPPTLTKYVKNASQGNNGSINLTVSGGQSPYQYDWDNDGVGDNDDKEDLYSINAGIYTVIVTDANGCSVTLSVTVENTSSINETTKSENNLLAFPNPVNNILNVEVNNHEQIQNLQLYNCVGNLVYSSIINQGKYQIETDKLSNGIYLLKVQTSDKVLSSQINIEH